MYVLNPVETVVETDANVVATKVAETEDHLVVAENANHTVAVLTEVATEEVTEVTADQATEEVLAQENVNLMVIVQKEVENANHTETVLKEAENVNHTAIVKRVFLKVQVLHRKKVFLKAAVNQLVAIEKVISQEKDVRENSFNNTVIA